MVCAKNRDVSKKPLTPVMEDYMEAIYKLNKEKKVVRVKDIARQLDVRMPTVTNMLKTLNERGMVDYQKYEYIGLTDDGAQVGREVQHKHETLRTFLVDILQVELTTADEEACKMEHALGSTTLENLIAFMAFIQECPRVGASWLHFFEEYRRHGRIPEKCMQHADGFSETFRHRVEQVKKDCSE
jgi:DtxR family Mn-dependent transcriptional regulator